MNLPTTILGLLSWKSASGYDLKRIISGSQIFYWSGNNNQIYKSLLELHKEGLVTAQVQLQESLPAKKVYAITEKGLSELQRGLLTAPEAPQLHKSFLIQLAWAEILSDAEVLDLLNKYESEIIDCLHLVRGRIARPDNSPARSKRERYLWQRITENLVVTYQTELDWVRQTQAAFHEGKFSG